MMRRFITTVEVGPRDGLQNVTNKILSPQVKAHYINLLISGGVKNIEVGSFVSDSMIQMRSTREVIGLLRRPPGVNFMALVGNKRYAEEAAKYPLQTFCVFTTVSETFCQKNNGCDIAKNHSKILEIIEIAKQHNIKVRGYLSCVFGCSYEGYESGAFIEKTLWMVKELLSAGCYEVSIADTIGTATPVTIMATINALVDAGVDLKRVALHLHDPKGMAKNNLVTALKMGIDSIDCATGGIGGCPKVTNPSSNIDTLTVARTLNELHLSHTLNYRGVLNASRYIQSHLRDDWKFLPNF